MPTKLKTACRHIGCPALTHTAYCQKHKQEDYRRYKYDRRWDKVRKIKVRCDPLCEICTREGRVTEVEIVHHIQSVRDRPDLLLDLDNLMSVCRYHHGKLHRGD